MSSPGEELLELVNLLLTQNNKLSGWIDDLYLSCLTLEETRKVCGNKNRTSLNNAVI